MPPKRHKIINKSQELNANLVKRQDECEREIGLAEKKLSELVGTEEKFEQARKRLRVFLAEKKNMIETICDLRTVFLSIIEDHNYLTDDNLDAMYPPATKRMREFMQETAETDVKVTKKEQGSVKDSIVSKKRRAKGRSKNTRKRRKQEREKKRAEKRKMGKRNK